MKMAKRGFGPNRIIICMGTGETVETMRLEGTERITKYPPGTYGLQVPYLPFLAYWQLDLMVDKAIREAELIYTNTSTKE